MNIRRAEILNELGLMPLWRIRTARETVTQLSSLEKENLCPPPQTNRVQISQMNWQQLKVKVEQCAACTLSKARTQTVFGVGDEGASWLYVGEGPGEVEDATGEPFTGPAGKLLDNMLLSIGLTRGRHVYIANVIKCRPPKNRNPVPNETQQCAPYLARQIELINPKLIIALGKVAVLNLLKQDVSISSLRGKLHYYNGTPLIVTYHPAYLLRELSDKAKAWKDLCFAKATMQSLQTKFTDQKGVTP